MGFAKLKKIMLIVIGTLALALGFIGVFLPVLPTTPFLLLSAWCFLRSSEKLFYWLTSHPLFGVYIYNYIAFRAITRGARHIALLFLWVMLTGSILASANMYLAIFLSAVGIGVTIHLFALKTLDSSQFHRPGLARESQKELI